EQDLAINNFTTVNLPYVSVTLCDKTGNCQTIDHIVVDTGSYGLRVLASAVSSLNLPATTTLGGGALAECATFLGGFMWGGIHNATLKMAGETATDIPIELMTDPSLPSTAPAGCQSPGGDIGNLNGIGGNGLLGVGQFVEDQGSYYACVGGASGSCNATLVAASNQVSNPVAYFAADNNGVILQMPAISNYGQKSATGTLTFGIDTQANNSVAAYKILPADGLGNFTATIAGQVYSQSFIDSGSNYSFMNLSGYNTNGYGDYAPPAYTSLAGTLTSNNVLTSPAIPVQLGMINTIMLNFTSFTAFNDIIDPGSPGTADLGMPFFYGQSIAFLIYGKQVAEGVGPFYGFH
ncbi:MAG: DUF3443 family protein, partial [Ferrovum sp.]|nr:DUF3443 family protein [Ferrovum sp.]